MPARGTFLTRVAAGLSGVGLLVAAPGAAAAGSTPPPENERPAQRATQPAEATAGTDANAIPEPRTEPARPAATDDERPLDARLGFGGELRIAGAVHRPSASVALSGDYSWRRAALGIGVELNPYFGVGDGDVVPGALHIFASGEHRVPIGRVTLRQRLNVGPAVLLADTLGHPRGAAGLFLEAAPLGLEIQTRVRRLAVVLEAFSLAVSAPSPRETAAGDPPLVRYQYRATIGLRF
ncbi:MAG: hypothetical protein KC486_15900 [Myxococcales bacterium]|nr:hypothetical protein [Myxococcales bacterium]